ncbi:MAG: hypothetical protein CMB56_007150 [Methanobacteriota archaeon]|nr:MAG: hypothetical protein CMB56_007150 [Euryarchaeota archaeon]|tara:strand:+ start:2238 stop:2555 length:318 start_codon:yes stop_codon:yes gene_type:complete
MNNSEILQNILRDIQSTRQQLMSTSSQIREFEVTLDALKGQDEDKKVYRQIGALLFEIDDLESMNTQLSSSIDTLKEHLKLLEKQDNELKNKYDEVVLKIEKSES